MSDPGPGLDPAVAALGERVVEELVAEQPTLATYLGIPGYDDVWDDLRPEGRDRLGGVLRRSRRAFAELGRVTGSWNLLATDVASAYLDRELEVLDHGEHLRDLNTVASPFQEFQETFDTMDTATVDGWRNVVSRLFGMRDAMRGYRATLDEGRRRGLVASGRQAAAAADQGDLHAGDSSFLTAFPDRFAASGLRAPDVEHALPGAVAAGRAAYAEMAAYLRTDYMRDAASTDAVGGDRYRRQARRFLGTDVDLAATYAWGWDEVRRIWEDMHGIAREMGVGDGLAATMAVLRTDPAHAAPNIGLFLEMMQERQERALSGLDGAHFDVPEQIRRVEVRLAPPGGALGAYYHQPSEDFSRPGTIWYVLGTAEHVPLYDQVSTAYHEGFPGHHLQAGLQTCLSDRLTRLHRLLVWYSGAGEGWALYAERLMGELGYYELPEYRLGQLVNEIHRACRVVIDIGVHLGLPIPDDAGFHAGEKWTSDLATEMLRQRAFLDADYAESEVNRYLGWPGQAISYKVGERCILEMREEARRRPGFDARDLHRRLLEAGAVGLDTVRRAVIAGADDEP